MPLPELALALLLGVCVGVVRVAEAMEPEETPLPASRLKGQVACFSCFAKNAERVNVLSAVPRPPSHENMTEISEILARAGMAVPVLAHRCADTMAMANPNFAGADLHVCPNTPEEPGACVKFKGYYKGEAFVYRECWSRMWKDPRPFKHHLSGMCFSDEFVQSFVESERNTICFCEDDLCNGYGTLSFLLPVALNFLFNYYYCYRSQGP